MAGTQIWLLSISPKSLTVLTLATQAIPVTLYCGERPWAPTSSTCLAIRATDRSRIPTASSSPGRLMMEGGVQLNVDGRRFSNEHLGYSEQGPHVLAQPGRLAWDVYDATIHEFAMNGFPDYRDAHSAGAVKVADTATDLASLIGAPVAERRRNLGPLRRATRRRCRSFWSRLQQRAARLPPPYYAIKVTGALFHTQGGLRIDGRRRA